MKRSKLYFLMSLCWRFLAVASLVLADYAQYSIDVVRGAERKRVGVP
jgi:hypothetical protein